MGFRSPMSRVRVPPGPPYFVVVCGLESISSRVIGAKKKGSKNLAGIVVFLDSETLLMLEDIASVTGSIDEAVARAIRREHAQIFGGEYSEVESISKGDLEEIVRRLEERLASLMSRSPPAGPPAVSRRDLDLDMPPLQAEESGEEEEEELALEDVLESVMVVEVDNSGLSGAGGREEEDKKNER